MAIVINLIACAEEKPEGDYPVIDLIGHIEKYQRAYCSDYFSSIELIPLETRDECLLPNAPFPRIILKDDYIFMRGEHLNAFDISGKFLYKIGRIGQGPGEYLSANIFFSSTDKQAIYVDDVAKISEYDFKGNYIRSIQKPKINNKIIIQISSVGGDMFIGSIHNDGETKYKYFLFNGDGKIVECFPNHVFFKKEGEWVGTYHRSLTPFRVEDKLYLKDYVNDTLYVYENSKLKPAYIFEVGKYSIPIECLEKFEMSRRRSRHFAFNTGLDIVGTPKFFFYNTLVPDIFPCPKTKPRYNHLVNEYRSTNRSVYGIYDIEKNTNMLLDTDQHHQKGIVNDLNGGLPVFPRYYAGDNLVVDVWNAEEMKEMLTEEYFEKQTIKDQEGHQKLKKILANLKEDDNPVVVVARLK
ncbi:MULTISPECIES: 6-bladed beta-propeller [unclassified Parabacteroides]|uniref:6-bladed beta-propeller n=1 Tax=unclassified Parabacteroides TaxID=2649774 RepID=UPI0024742166|nr:MULTISPECIES: 6-bladed beta-propeller [unclassified Parabacteroides]